MKISHIYHSGVSVELENAVLIFDWYTGKLPAFDPELAVYCFVSHGHADHFGPCITGLAGKHKKLHYICDRKVRLASALEREAEITRVRAHERYEVGDLELRTLQSTDEGVAFLVKAEGYMIYHAGDLNIWYWDDEPEADNRWQVGTFKKEISALKGETIDLACLPLDPRLESHGADGMACFLSEIPCKKVLPMHYWDRREEARAYLADPRLSPYAEHIDFSDNFDYS